LENALSRMGPFYVFRLYADFRDTTGATSIISDDEIRNLTNQGQLEWDCIDTALNLHCRLKKELSHQAKRPGVFRVMVKARHERMPEGEWSDLYLDEFGLQEPEKEQKVESKEPTEVESKEPTEAEIIEEMKGQQKEIDRYNELSAKLDRMREEHTVTKSKLQSIKKNAGPSEFGFGETTRRNQTSFRLSQTADINPLPRPKRTSFYKDGDILTPMERLDKIEAQLKELARKPGDKPLNERVDVLQAHISDIHRTLATDFVVKPEPFFGPDAKKRSYWVGSNNGYQNRCYGGGRPKDWLVPDEKKE
jgi:hypothetical protein